MRVTVSCSFFLFLLLGTLLLRPTVNSILKAFQHEVEADELAKCTSNRGQALLAVLARACFLTHAMMCFCGFLLRRKSEILRFPQKG